MSALWWLIIALFVFLLVRHPFVMLALPVSLLVLQEFGDRGLGILLAVALILAVTRQASPPRPSRQ
jgi:hypothetical protein